VNEQAKMDARSPRDRIPRHRSPVARRHQAGEHAEKDFLRDRRRAVHRHRASATQDGLLRGEQTLVDGGAEELLAFREPGEGLGHRRASGSARGLRYLVDHGPLDAVLGAQRVGLAVP
jgi:hypothetical protein